jgi:hypothetical protein
MRLPRMTTRRWMTAVVVVAVVLSAGVLLRRNWELSVRALYHDTIEKYQAEKMESLEQLALSATTPGDAERLRVDAATEAAIGQWHARLKEKYRRAARCPWLPVEPDPPRPEP